MSETNVDKSEEPSIMSTDPEERILARRLRIQRRLDAMKKQDNEENDDTDNKTTTENQIHLSIESMQKLINEGDELISNIRIANDAREIHRREEDFKIRKTLLEQLKEEAKNSEMKCTTIYAKWMELLESKDPLDIYGGIESQKIKCQEILAQKDNIISKLKKAVDNTNNNFDENQKKQNENINLLIDRISSQIEEIYNTYRNELLLIENTLKTERANIIKDIKKEWNFLFDIQQKNLRENEKRKQEIMREFEKEKNKIFIQDQEKYSKQNRRFETTCQKLQQQLETTKTLCLLNLEKFDHSFNVLKRRERENIIVKNEQNRQIFKLQDLVNNMKKAYIDLEAYTKMKTEKLLCDVNKAQKNIEDLQLKSTRSTISTNEQFIKIWDMNTKRADKLLEQIFEVDKSLHEQMLGSEWEPPKETLLKTDQLPSCCKAMLNTEQDNAEKDKSQNKEESSAEINVEKQLLKHIMMQISDEAEFLIGEKIFELLSQYSKEKRTIMKLDHVFQALNITSEDKINVLIEFFLPYSYCPSCTEENEKKKDKLLCKLQKEKEFEDETICPCTSSESDESAAPSKQEVLENISTESKTDENNIEEPEDSKIEPATEETDNFEKNNCQENDSKCYKDHLLEIKTENVIKALTDFEQKYREAMSDEISENVKETISDKKVLLSCNISEEDMKDYWKRYREIFSSKRENIWDAMMTGLQKYLDILKERQKLINKTETMQKQNSELRRLLENYKTKLAANLARNK